MAQKELLTATLMLALLDTGTAAIASSEAEANYRKRFPAQWLEREGEIRLDTICYNYPDGSYMYRLCRQQAAQTLQGRCSRYQALLNTYSGDTGTHYRRLADKYCTASEQYQPEGDSKE
jgi:hypothetical protein